MKFVKFEHRPTRESFRIIGYAIMDDEDYVGEMSLIDQYFDENEEYVWELDESFGDNSVFDKESFLKLYTAKDINNKERHVFEKFDIGGYDIGNFMYPSELLHIEEYLSDEEILELRSLLESDEDV
jgi:hypothetical protein